MMDAMMTATASTLPGLFHDSARRYPDNLALRVADVDLSYAELARSAGHAARLIDALVRPGAPRRRFGLLANRGLAAYLSYLAIARLGCAVVPMSPDAPQERLRVLCEEAGLDGIVADANGAARIAGTQLASDVPVLQLPDTPAPGPADPEAPWAPPAPADLAYILFTSGTTGRPKGVPIRHDNIVPYILYNRARYRVGPRSRLSQTFDLTFDPSVFDLFVAWASGAALIVPDRSDLFAPVDFVKRNGITHWFSVPSLISMAQRQDELAADSMPDLEWSLFAGEQLTIDQARAWRAAAPRAVIENLYGPTELSVTCVAHRLPAEPERWPVTSNGTVPIGLVYPHLEGMLYQESDGQGELLIRGSQRCAGYLNAADNAGRFVADDGTGGFTVLDGAVTPGEWDWYRTGDLVEWSGDVLVHKGRIDDQLKVRGVRVEASEIEAAVRRHDKVLEAAVVPVKSADGDSELVAAYTGEEVSRRELLDVLRTILPPHMIPDRFVFMTRLPLNSSGKIDRKTLRGQFT